MKWRAIRIGRAAREVNTLRCVGAFSLVLGRNLARSRSRTQKHITAPSTVPENVASGSGASDGLLEGETCGFWQQLI